jgi:hypothetical protein
VSIVLARTGGGIPERVIEWELEVRDSKAISRLEERRLGKVKEETCMEFSDSLGYCLSLS